MSEDGRIIVFTSRDRTLLPANLTHCNPDCPSQVYRFDRDTDGNGIFDEPARRPQLALVSAVDAASPEQRLALIRSHPDLVGRAALTGSLTRESTAEQRAAGLDPGELTPETVARFAEANAAYTERFAAVRIIIPPSAEGNLDWRTYTVVFDFRAVDPEIIAVWRWGWTP